MKNANGFESIERVAALAGKLGQLVGVSISLDRGAAVVTIKRDYSPFEGREYCTLEYCEGASGLFYGHYDLSQADAAADHRARFNRITGVQS